MSANDPMRKVMKLFLVLAEEEKSVEEVHAAADDLFHSECRMQFEGEQLNKPRIMADLEALVAKKTTMDLIKVEKDELGLTYEYTVKEPRQKPRKMEASAMIRDGKLYHVDVKKMIQTAPSGDARMRRVSAPVIHPAIHGF